MILWHSSYQTLRPLGSFPRLLTVASETIDTPAYRHEGRYRQGERHCIFKVTLEGEGRYRDAAGEHRVPAGTGFLCEIRDAETAYYYPPDGTAPWTFVWVSFTGETAVAQVRELLARYGAIYALPLDGAAVGRILACRRDDGVPCEVTAAEGAAQVSELLLALAAAGEPDRDEPTAAEALVRRARVAAEANVERCLNAGDLARMVGVSREHLSRAFAEVLGVSPYRYLQRERMLLACHLLKEAGCSVKETAARLGYDAPAHFSRAFKRAIGIPPGRFRRVGTVPVA